MNWTFHPKTKELTTSLPLSIEINNFKGRPVVILEGVGELDLVRQKDGALKADFYVSLPGTYSLKLKDSQQTVIHQFEVKQHRYLDFGNEFGLFFILFLCAMGGIVLWTKKIMKKKMI